MDFWTFGICWLTLCVFLTICGMRWEHCKNWRFYAYLPAEFLINFFLWPFHVSAVFQRYKQMVPTKLYDYQK